MVISTTEATSQTQEAMVRGKLPERVRSRETRQGRNGDSIAMVIRYGLPERAPLCVIQKAQKVRLIVDVSRLLNLLALALQICVNHLKVRTE
jgi:hypothetical protein